MYMHLETSSMFVAHVFVSVFAALSVLNHARWKFSSIIFAFADVFMANYISCYVSSV
jgi:hypothetical protein